MWQYFFVKEKRSIAMRHFFETAVIVIGTLGWWGFIYPELCMTQETYELVEEYETQDMPVKGEKVCIKSKAVEYLFLIKEKADSKEDLCHDK